MLVPLEKTSAVQARGDAEANSRKAWHSCIRWEGARHVPAVLAFAQANRLGASV
jgi:hypothetical protein